MDNYPPESEPGERARIGSRVRYWRRKAKLTLSKAAENAGVSRQEFQDIESGQRPMLLEEAALFASAINGLKTDDLAKWVLGMPVIKKKLSKPRVDGRGEKPKGKRPTAAQLVATRKVITIPVGKVSKVQQASMLTTVERQRFEMLEAMLLNLRRAVATVLVTGIDGNQDILEDKAGELMAMLNIMEKRGDLRPGCLMKKFRAIAAQWDKDIPEPGLQN